MSETLEEKRNRQRHTDPDAYRLACQMQLYLALSFDAAYQIAGYILDGPDPGPAHAFIGVSNEERQERKRDLREQAGGDRMDAPVDGRTPRPLATVSDLPLVPPLEDEAQAGE